MSVWRREASAQLPELQRIIASKDTDSPMMLWIELNLEFERFCELAPPPIDLLVRIWRYCRWCLANGTDDVRTAAALAFCEHLIDTPVRTALIPKIMTRDDFLDFRNLLEYHNTPAEVDLCLRTLWPQSAFRRPH